MSCSHGNDPVVKGGTAEHPGPFMDAVIATARELTTAGKAVDAEAVVTGVAARLGVSSRVVGALAAGQDAMAEYALSALDDGVDAIGEEEGAIAASRRAFRPLLEARLQDRIDRMDELRVRRKIAR